MSTTTAIRTSSGRLAGSTPCTPGCDCAKHRRMSCLVGCQCKRHEPHPDDCTCAIHERRDHKMGRKCAADCDCGRHPNRRLVR